MEKKRRYKFGLRRRLIILITVLALITYSTSAVFINFLHSYVENYLSQQLFMLITLLLGIIWSGILTFFAAGFITKPLQRLEQAVVRAGEGDIATDVVVHRADDEISSLGRSFNQMLSNFRNMVHQIEDNFQQTNEHVISISQKSTSATKQAEGTAHTLSEISAGAESSAIAIQATAESVDNIIQIAQEVQSKAKESEEVSGDMVEELTESKEVVQSLVSGIERLASGNRESLQAVRRLEDNAKKVEQIIQLVGDIATQTNLLALNASIEAARAGEHGQGFAVVAEEVRKLADESATAVQGISELIQNIQVEVEHVVGQITDQVDLTNEEAKKGTKTNEVIAEMTETIHLVANAVKDISALVDKQMESVQETSLQSQEVAAIAEETSAGALEVAATTKEQVAEMEEIDHIAGKLRDQAIKLKDTIAIFCL